MRFLISLTVLAGLSFCFLADIQAGDKKDDWVSDFRVKKGELTSTGRNPYFILEPGYFQILEDEDEKLFITVLNETKVIDGITCRIVEEKETKGGKVTESSRSYYAISKFTKNVYYFGEDVFKPGKDGKLARDEEDSWVSGENGAKFGLLMPGRAVVKAKFYQEQAPKVAMDRAEILSVTEIVKTPAGTFKDCLKIEETTPLKADHKEHKFYAPGIGIVQDGDLKLIRSGFLKKS